MTCRIRSEKGSLLAADVAGAKLVLSLTVDKLMDELPLRQCFPHCTRTLYGTAFGVPLLIAQTFTVTVFAADTYACQVKPSPGSPTGDVVATMEPVIPDTRAMPAVHCPICNGRPPMAAVVPPATVEACVLLDFKTFKLVEPLATAIDFT